MAFDAEAAWADLAEKIEEREGWGAKPLLAEMRRLESKHRISEGLFQRFLRIYGGRFTVAVRTGEVSPSGGGRVEPDLAAAPRSITDSSEEEHDEHRSDRRAAVA